MPLQTAGWYESWSDWDTTKVPFSAAAISPIYDVVLIAFAQPDSTYTKGAFTWSGTGLQFSGFNPFATVQQTIKDLRAAGTKVILSVGGQTYNNWDQFNLTALDALVTDLGCDGLELDFELTKTRADLLKTIVGQCLTKPWQTWIAAFSVGAYDGSQSPAGSDWEGVNLPAIKAFGSTISGINIMAYNAGPTYNPLVAYDAFRKSCPNAQINIAWMVPPEDWGGHVVNEQEVVNVAQALVAKGGSNGMCVWTIQRGLPFAKNLMGWVRQVSPKGSAPASSVTPPTPTPSSNPPAPNASGAGSTTTPTSADSSAGGGNLYITLYDLTTGNPIKVPVNGYTPPIFNPVTGQKL